MHSRCSPNTSLLNKGQPLGEAHASARCSAHAVPDRHVVVESSSPSSFIAGKSVFQDKFNPLLHWRLQPHRHLQPHLLFLQVLRSWQFLASTQWLLSLDCSKCMLISGSEAVLSSLKSVPQMKYLTKVWPQDLCELLQPCVGYFQDGSEGGEGPVLLRRAAASRQLGEGTWPRRFGGSVRSSCCRLILHATLKYKVWKRNSALQRMLLTCHLARCSAADPSTSADSEVQRMMSCRPSIMSFQDAEESRHTSFSSVSCKILRLVEPFVKGRHVSMNQQVELVFVGSTHSAQHMRQSAEHCNVVPAHG